MPRVPEQLAFLTHARGGARCEQATVGKRRPESDLGDSESSGRHGSLPVPHHDNQIPTRAPPPALPFLSYCDREGQYFPQEKLCYTYRFSVLSRPYLDRCPYTLDPSLLSQGPPHTHSVLPSISQNQGAWDRKHGSSFSPSSGAGSGFPRSSCHLCWANFT